MGGWGGTRTLSVGGGIEKGGVGMKTLDVSDRVGEKGGVGTGTLSVVDGEE